MNTATASAHPDGRTATAPPGAEDVSSYTVSQGIDKAGEEVHAVIESLSELARLLLADIVSGAHDAVDGGAAGALRVTRTLGIDGDAFEVATGKALEAARLKVRVNPVMCLGLALLAGVAVDRLLSGR